MSMTYKEIVDLIKLVNKTDLTEIRIQDGEFKLSIRSKDFNTNKTEVISQPVSFTPVSAPAPAAAPAPVATSPIEPAPAAPAELDRECSEVPKGRQWSRYLGRSGSDRFSMAYLDTRHRDRL